MWRGQLRGGSIAIQFQLSECCSRSQAITSISKVGMEIGLHLHQSLILDNLKWLGTCMHLFTFHAKNKLNICRVQTLQDSEYNLHPCSRSSWCTHAAESKLVNFIKEHKHWMNGSWGFIFATFTKKLGTVYLNLEDEWSQFTSIKRKVKQYEWGVMIRLFWHPKIHLHYALWYRMHIVLWAFVILY